jgi:hypothetical protein
VICRVASFLMRGVYPPGLVEGDQESGPRRGGAASRVQVAQRSDALFTCYGYGGLSARCGCLRRSDPQRPLEFSGITRAAILQSEVGECCAAERTGAILDTPGRILLYSGMPEASSLIGP